MILPRKPKVYANGKYPKQRTPLQSLAIQQNWIKLICKGAEGNLSIIKNTQAYNKLPTHIKQDIDNAIYWIRNFQAEVSPKFYEQRQQLKETLNPQQSQQQLQQPPQQPME